MWRGPRLIAPLIKVIPAVHVAVVLSYPILLVCVSICDRIVSTFLPSFNMHSKNTSELVLKDNIAFFNVLGLSAVSRRSRLVGWQTQMFVPTRPIQ